jgi:hypothetical protein
MICRFVEEITTKTIEIMKAFKIIKRIYGAELNQVNPKTYATKEDAINAGNSWENDCTVHSDLRKPRNFEVVEVEI